jgi:tetratricopeptide (TPR) repeat protein
MSPADLEQRAQPSGAGRRVLLRPWLPAVIGVLCFANIIFLGNSFVYDDTYIVRDNPRLRDLSNLKAIWLSDWWHPPNDQAALPNPNRDRLYRPLTLFTYALNYAAGGLWPAGFHLVNVALHALACVLVWHFAQRLFGDAALSTCAALLFAVHPVHCEAVANIVGRAEILCALLLLAGLLILLPPTGTPGFTRALTAGLAFFAALLAKETAVCYPALALLALHARIRLRPAPRWWLMHTAILLLPLVLYLPLRYVSLEQRLLRTPVTAGLFNPLRMAEPSGRVTGPLTILGHYTRLMIVPSRLSCDYGTAIVDPQAGPNAMTMLGGLTAAGGVAALVGYRRRPRSTWRQMAVATALLAASYVLISNTVLLIGVSLAERLMYWPSVPALLLVAAAVMWVWRNPCAEGRALHRVARLLRVCGILLLVVVGLRTVFRNLAWTSNAELFFTDVATYPQGAHLNKAAAGELIQLSTRIRDEDEYKRRRILAHAEHYLIQALQIYPRYPGALRDRGRVHAILGDVEGAIRYFESALQLAPRDTASKEYLARLRGETQTKQARLDELLRQIQQRPDEPAPRKEVGQLLIELARPREALEHVKHAVRLAPEDTAALCLLGQVLMLHHESAEAIDVYEKVLLLDPNDWEAHTNLTALLARRDPAAALQHARQAHRLRPNDLHSNENLAEALAANELYQQALERYDLIRRGFPENHPYRAVIRDRIAELERLRQ